MEATTTMPTIESMSAAMGVQHDAPLLSNGKRIPDIPHLPPSPQTVDDYPRWRDAILKHRIERIKAVYGPNGAEERQEELRRIIADVRETSGLYLMNTWGSIYDARPPEDELEDGVAGFFVPLILFPFQMEYVLWINERLHSKTDGDGLAIKARQMGLSNITAFTAACRWMVITPMQIRMLSRTEDLVDEPGNPDSIFWKIEMFVKGLPDFIVQGLMPGFNWKKHRRPLRFINPANMNVIKGESTQANAGRGAAVTWIIYDEGAFIPDFGAVWTAGRASTRHRLVLSTASIDRGMDFYNLHHGLAGYTQPSVFVVPYNEYPGHDEQWLAEERKRDTPEGIAREVLMDYFAGGGQWVYPEAHERNVGDYPYLPGAGPVYVAIDDGFDDDFAIVWIQYIKATGRFRVFQAYRNRHLVTDFYGSLLTGVPESQFFTRYGHREREIMRRQRELPSMTYTADTHIRNREQITGKSPMEHLATKYNIVTTFDFRGRDFVERRLTTGGLLPLFDFHDHDGAPEVLDAFQHYRFKSVDEGKDQQAEFKTPLHSSESHYVTAVEWFIGQWETLKVTLGGSQKIRWSGADNG